VRWDSWGQCCDAIIGGAYLCGHEGCSKSGRRHRLGRNVVAVGLWDVAVPLGSVLITGVVTGGVAIWSKIIDARTKREDREHAGKLDYEGRAWQTKKDALPVRLIRASWP
jgi:hypothetical protein